MMRIEDWGVIEYEAASDRQLRLVEQVSAGGLPETIVFCSHPPVVTLGRSSPESDITYWQGPIVRSSRGGRATYHGPNQLVIYPILDLRREDRPTLRTRDVGCYIRWLGQSMVHLLHHSGINGEFRQGLDMDEQGLKRQLTGLWVADRKVASMGVAIKKWITYHGVALNVFTDPTAFQGISPCGFKTETMTSIEEILGQRPNLDSIKKSYLEIIAPSLS